MTKSNPLKWHGGKSYLAKWIVEQMPPHLHYVEPYFGGGAVLFARDPGRSEVVNDLNEELTNFWRVLQREDSFRTFKRVVDAIPFSQQEFDRAVEDTSHDPVDRAVAFFVRYRQSRQGMGKGFATLTRNRTRRSMNEQASSWLTVVEGLAEAHGRLHGVVIVNTDAIALINQQDGPNTLFYCDPPYLPSTRTALSAYECEMTEHQHAELLETLRDITGDFILSGYRNPLYDSMAGLAGWYRVDREIDNKASSAKTKEIKTESLWMNFNNES